jgi:hypothetical protein
MPFGQYQGFDLTEIPESYLRWIRAQKWVGDWLHNGIDRVLGNGPEADVEECEVLPAFSVHPSGNGQVIVSQEGDIIAWTREPWVGQVICKLLNENETLIYQNKEK